MSLKQPSTFRQKQVVVLDGLLARMLTSGTITWALLDLNISSMSLFFIQGIVYMQTLCIEDLQWKHYSKELKCKARQGNAMHRTAKGNVEHNKTLYIPI